MSDVVLKVEKLGKRYNLPKAGGRLRYRTMRDELVDLPSRIRSKFRSGQTHEDFWALREVSFEVVRGEVLGIIGRNGAGKSTLLKIMSRIVEPTEGIIDIYGRVGSLLEVGTGFHPELTGRENIFLSGAMLGMRRHEVRKRLESIVEFAGVEKFLETPCKHYSSGMYARLGFAVAAHLDAEVLLVDEVLAVGDAEFQRRCLGKMGEVAKDGRTILFVSHNVAALERICSKGFVVERGRVGYKSDIKEALAHYRSTFLQGGEELVGHRKDRRGNGAVRICELLIGGKNTSRAELQIGQPVEFDFLMEGVANRIIFAIYDLHARLVVDFDSAFAGDCDRGSSLAFSRARCRIDSCLLMPGDYTLNVAILCGDSLSDHVETAIRLEVQAGVVGGRVISREGRGIFALPHRWGFDGGHT